LLHAYVRDEEHESIGQAFSFDTELTIILAAVFFQKNADLGVKEYDHFFVIHAWF